MFGSIINLIVYIIFIDMTYKVAKLDHRSGGMAILWSILFSFLAFIVYFYVYIGDLKRGDSEQKEIPITKLNN